MGLPAVSGSAAASSHAVETLYLTDSGGDNGGSHLTKLFEVTLDDSFSPPRAVLDLIVDLGDTDFDQVDALAATPDGEFVHFIDKNSEHLGEWDVDAETFTDLGVISGLPDNEVVLAAYGPGGTLYAAGQTSNTLYTVDPSGPSATAVVTISGATVQGADIAFDADGVLYLYTSASSELFTVDYDSTSSTFGDATLVGSPGSISMTGLAIRAAGEGDLVGSDTTNDTVVVLDPSDGSAGTVYEMYEGGSRYGYGYGDMTVGQLATCVECTADGVLAKYEFACVEWADDECVDHDFVLEAGDGGVIGYAGEEYTVKDGDEAEPMSVTFTNEMGYCSLYAVVKAGPESTVVEVSEFDGDGSFTVEAPGKYAISNVVFSCEEPDLGDGPGQGGRGRGR